MGPHTVTLLTPIIMAMTTLFPTTVMDYTTLTRFLAAMTVVTTAASIIASAAAKTIVMGIAMVVGSIMLIAVLNFHPVAALQHQLLAAAPAA